MAAAPPNPLDEPIIEGHDYDGIEEYDNPMPAWWLWLFWITVIFAPVYFVGVHVAGFIPTYTDDLQAEQADLQAIREAHEASGPSFRVDAATLGAYVADPLAVEAGRALFQANCVACHGPAGAGLIGPNLTDEYWIHGDSDMELFGVITDGVLDKGMTPWGGILAPEQRAQLLAFVRSLAGTNPEGAKEPQGTHFPGI